MKFNSILEEKRSTSAGVIYLLEVINKTVVETEQDDLLAWLSTETDDLNRGESQSAKTQNSSNWVNFLG